MVESPAAEIDRRVRSVLAEHSLEFPELLPISPRVDEEQRPELVDAAVSDSADNGQTIVIHAGVSWSRDDLSLELAVLRCLACAVWRRELSKLGLDIRGAIQASGDDEGETGSWLREDLIDLERLGTEIVLAERVKVIERYPWKRGLERNRSLDGLAYSVANACEFYANLARPSPENVPCVSSYIVAGTLALRRYLSLRKHIRGPLSIRGLLFVAERPGFEFLRGLADLS